MLPSKHFIFGLIFAAFLYFIFPQVGLIEFSIIIFSTVLIDVDHYLYYVYKKKDLSLKNSYKWFMKRRKKFFSISWKQRNAFKISFSFLHGIEVLAILFLLSFIHKYFLFVFTGFAFHLLLDSIEQTTYWNRIIKISLVKDYLDIKK